MIETAREFLSQIDNYPVTSKLEKCLANSDRAIFVLHDQLNFDVFPKELLDQKPLLIFVESLAYATAIPHHKQKLVYILSAQRHFAIACYEQGFPVLNLFTEGFHADAIAEFLEKYHHIKLTYMESSEWNTRSQIAELKNKFGDRIKSIPNNFFIADADKFKPKIKKGYRL